MRFGAMNFPIHPVLQEIETFSGLGLDYLELAMDPPRAHYSQLRSERNDIRAALSDRGLGLVCHLPTFVHTADLIDSIRRASVEEVFRSLDVAAELGAEKTVLHPGYIEGLGGYVLDRVRRLALDSLQRICDHARRLGIAVGVENLFSSASPYSRADHFDPVFQQCPSFGLVLDVAHAYIGQRSAHRCLAFIERWQDRLGHLHMSDNKGVRDDHLPVGAGSLPFKTIVSRLRDIGYDDTITLEVFVQDRKALVKSRDRLAAMFKSGK